MSTINRAHVWVDQNMVGDLTASGIQMPSTFMYQTEVTNSEAVSVTMPIQNSAYTFNGLHPIFAQNLPEGYLGAILRKVISKHYGSSEIALLTALGRYQVGRVFLSSALTKKENVAQTDTKGESLKLLLQSKNHSLFEELVDKYALRSGISGVQPKVVVPHLMDERSTLRTKGFIVKSWGDDFPQLAANEYFCMSLAKQTGLNVPEFDLSQDGRLFVMTRFDRTPTNQWLGFEDGCVLQGLAPADKYSGSYERLIKSISTYLSPHHKREGLHQLFKSLLASWVVQNGDAHLKNFGILYDHPFGDRQLAPTYDIVSTTPYLKHDVPALTLGGRKIWWPIKQLTEMGRTLCNLSAYEIRLDVQITSQAIKQTLAAIKHYIVEKPNFEEVGHAMIDILSKNGRVLEAYLLNQRHES
jgi:serine/threonine-protein kinase HipA